MAFVVDGQGEVDDAFQRCASIGARIHHPPEQDQDQDMKGYYAFFVFDPDGIGIEVCSWTDQAREQ